jgi:hypothetical protein
MRLRRNSMKRRPLLVVAALLVAAATAVAALHMAMQPSVEAAEPLTAYAPRGSLMAVESPDFAALLTAWTNSDEVKAWVKSDNYAEFSHSRLFSRLGEAQSEFAASAGLAPDAQFLSQVAGKESLFAWYDIGQLEFLYVTRMKPGEAANNPLMKLKDKFQMRRAGADSFYSRAEAAKGGVNDGVDVGTARTVAFAVHGDLLLLATREDLIANALLLAQHQGDANLKNEPWYTAAVSSVQAAKDGVRPDMRMTLNLAKIVPSPYFRSYWVQKNVTEMKQYSAAISDLYRTAAAFREERVLIPKAVDALLGTGDMRPVLRYLPAEFGVYRATAQPGTAEVVDELDRRLISRTAAPYRDLRIAPVADLSDRSVGSSGDLDTRIDEQQVPEVSMARTLDGLKGLIDAAHPEAMLVYSAGSGGGPAPDADVVFQPLHAAMVLTASAPWDAGAAEGALVKALRERLTVGGVGLSWQARQQDGESWMELSGLEPLAMAVRGGTLIVASDSETLLRLLQSAKKGAQVPDLYGDLKMVAGFSHAAERERYLRLTALLDRNHAAPGAGDGSTVTGSPDFFSKDMGSLSETFKALDSETFTESAGANGAVRQTVVYRWRR